jgi:hypothetical protein
LQLKATQGDARILILEGNKAALNAQIDASNAETEKVREVERENLVREKDESMKREVKLQNVSDMTLMPLDGS